MITVSKLTAILALTAFFIAAPAHFPTELNKAEAGEAKVQDDQGGFIHIISPKDGEKLSFTKAIIMKYEMGPGIKGNHVHFYVDGENIGMTRLRKGSFDLGRLKQGKRILTMKLVNTRHIPLGLELSIKVTIP